MAERSEIMHGFSIVPKHVVATTALLAASTLASCTQKEAPKPQAVASSYANLVYMNYSDALTSATELQAALTRLVEQPSASRFEFAKRAWLKARDIYGQTEAFRFYAGPIDNETGPEGRINGWPLDEAYIDYVDGLPDSGIVNNPAIEITKEKLASINEGAAGDILQRGEAFSAEKAIATGFHAIEFLLWGQDNQTFGPGQRPWQDYAAETQSSTRRGQYLKMAGELLVDDLQALVQAWAPDTDNFRKTFVAQDPKTSLRNMLTGIGILTKGELASERIDVALDTLDQEDEHSCFSDNTGADLVANALGIRNVYVGAYSIYSGPSLSDLVYAKDPALDKSLRALLDQAVTTAKEIPAPFDEAIKDRNGAGWKKANELVQTLFAAGDKFVVVGTTLGLGAISVSLPE